MKIFYLLFSLMCIGASVSDVYAQNWRTLKQPPLGLRYKIPYNWFVSSYMSPKNCACAGGASLNLPQDDGLRMLIFSDSLVGLDSLSRQSVGGYHFVENPKNESLATSGIWRQAQGYWQEAPQLKVLRFFYEIERKSYVFYFWAEQIPWLPEYDQTVEFILNSVEFLD